ncbi:MAG: sporulation initiation factor Spo0A C-terminal domain-containing protein [Eubacteriales bacterium]|nr:sporulation initiation factor Spo0A C-terminal domain-containing protein [Eubacteriales bacterium]
MLTVLLVLESEDFRLALVDALQRDYHVIPCGDPETGMRLLKQRPDILVLDLLLPGMDGLTFLENTTTLHPPVILALTPQISPYIVQAVSDLGGGFVITKPCTIRAVTNRISDMLRKLEAPFQADPQTIIRDHLLALRLSISSDGFQQLRIGIPLFAQDKTQRLSKELYPAIAQRFGCSAEAVERSIRDAINAAWLIRDESLWHSYFPNLAECPTNKVFIAQLAELLEM